MDEIIHIRFLIKGRYSGTVWPGLS